MWSRRVPIIMPNWIIFNPNQMVNINSMYVRQECFSFGHLLIDLRRGYTVIKNVFEILLL